jgi:hypothetical protein
LVKDKNEFLVETLRQIGGKISNTVSNPTTTKKKNVAEAE